MDRVKSIVGQKIVLYNHEGKVLILKRSATSNGAGNRDLPWGGILLHETPQESLQREIQEETGLQATNITLIHTAAKTYDDEAHGYFVGYKGHVQEGQKVLLSFEHDAYLWIDPNDIENYKLKEYRAETVKKSYLERSDV